MTRISGCFILCCPHCGALFRTPNYSSMNFMAMEAWTDGHKVNSLMPPSEYMRLCTVCDQIYDKSEALRISELTNEQMYDTVEEPAEPPRNWRAALWRHRTAAMVDNRCAGSELKAYYRSLAGPTNEVARRISAG